MKLRSLVLGATTALLLAPTAASAQQWSREDAAGDVVRFDDSSEQGTPVPTDTRTDVERITVNHRAYQVRLTLHVADVVRGSRMAIFGLRTSHGPAFDVTRMQGPDGTLLDITRRYDGRSVRCAGASGAIDPAADTAVVVLPRRCLGSPDWVRVGGAYLTFDDVSGLHVDDALRPGMEHERLTLGPRVHRG